jgi:heat shock protein HslJ
MIETMKKLFALLFVSSLLFTACKTAPISDFNTVKQLIESNTWLLQDENGTVVSYNNQEVSMNFDKTNGLQAVGFAGCNRYFATVTLLPESIKFGQAGSTMMACPEMEGEQAFLDLLSQVNSYEVSNNELKLFQNKILLMRFKKK